MAKSESRGDTKPDRLAAVLERKQQTLTLDDKDIVVCKWPLRKSLELSGKLGNIVRDVMKSMDVTNLKVNLGTVLTMDIEQLLGPHIDSIVQILARTLDNNFSNDLQAATEWVETLGLAEAIEVFIVIARQNLRPLGELLKKVAGNVTDGSDVAPKVLPPSTSLPH